MGVKRFGNNAHQRQIIFAALKAADDGEIMTILKLRKLFPERTQQAIQSNVRQLQRWGFVVRENHGSKGCSVIPTPQAYTRFRNANF